MEGERERERERRGCYLSWWPAGGEKSNGGRKTSIVVYNT